MEHASPTSDLSASPRSVDLQSGKKRDDLAYQSMTVAAILLLLFSLWVF
jgi:hypothetical protein